MMLRLTAITLILTTSVAWGQDSVLSNPDQFMAAPSTELTRLNTLKTNVNTLFTNYNTMKRAYDRYRRCANMGMLYVPNAASVPGRVAATGCAPLPNQPLVREVQFTSAATDGNMSAFGSTAVARMEGFMNANGCPTSAWRVCTEEELKYAFAKRIKNIDATSPDYAWYMGAEFYDKFKFSGASNYNGNYYCNTWASNAASQRGFTLALYNGTSTGVGLTLRTCDNSYRVACCR